ncbi:dipeptide/oligopeptide/nickel ABC transporter permease/ATP-binding protein [Microbacterium sp. NPDC056044]|uniref:dipeptide/oligopeptide/nickel ABC transporter permease/ATP-binding protein n=1 Tax=Microbacterium sp. NPDC056044 TaxID=3345690 RepID=UPI0035DF056C
MTVEVPPLADLTARSSAGRRFLKNPLGMIAAIVLGLIVVMAILAPWIMPHDPTVPMVDQINAGPNSVYLLGGDGSGRDVLSRLIAASRLTLIGSLTVAVVALLIGVTSGLLAGFTGRYVDGTLTWFNTILMAVPAMIILVALYAVIGPNTIVTMALFGVLLSPFIFRLVRALVFSVRRELYVDAARVSGLSEGRILTRHVLGAIRAPIILVMAGILGAGIMIQAGLEFLGLGSPTEPTWGGMLQNAFLNIYQAPMGILWAGLAIGLTTGSLGLIANALRDALEEPAPLASAKTRRTAQQTVANTPAPVTNVTDDVLLSVDGLTIAYPTSTDSLKSVVQDIGLQVRRGEIVGLVGESGSGKTQTAYSILGLLPQEAVITSGRIRFDGKDIMRNGEQRQTRLLGRHIAYVPQEPMSNLDPTFTIGYQLTRPMRRMLGLSKKDAHARAIALLTRVGIVDPERTMKKYPHEVSGGMAQRVLIASAVSSDPELIIADEPTTALDVTVQAEILDLLRELQAERKMSMLLVTHNFGVVADLCDRVAVMQKGQIVEVADVAAIFDHPQHPYTQMLLAATLEDTAPRTERERERVTTHE